MTRRLPRVVGTVPTFECRRGPERCTGRAARRDAYCSATCQRLVGLIAALPSVGERPMMMTGNEKTVVSAAFPWLDARCRIAS